MKLLISYLLIAVLSSLLLTGCGILEQEPYLSPLVKVKCRDLKTSQSLQVKTRQKKEITQSVQAIIPVNSETPVPKQTITKSISKINASIEKIMAIDKPLKMISKKIDIAPAMNIGLLLKNPANAQKNHSIKEKVNHDGITGLLSLIFLFFGVIFIYILANYTLFNTLLIIIGLSPFLASIILAIVGVSGHNKTDKILSWITLGLWISAIIFLISGLVYKLIKVGLP